MPSEVLPILLPSQLFEKDSIKNYKTNKKNYKTTLYSSQKHSSYDT